MMEQLAHLLLQGTLSVTSYDGHRVHIEFPDRDKADQLADLLEEVVGNSTPEPLKTS